MIVRALDALHDWTYGKGRNDYKTNKKAVEQNIDTRLNSYLGDCFFDTNAGIDWFRFLGSKDQTELALAVFAVIANTEFVATVDQLSINLSQDRKITIVYSVTTSFGALTTTSVFFPNQELTTEDGDVITTEDGDPIII